MVTIPSSVDLLAAFLLISVSAASAQEARSTEVDLDHVILGINDLQRGVAAFTRLTGVAPQFGGEHPGRGTHNALVSLGDGHYLEIIAPISSRPDSTLTELLVLNQLTPIGWALHTLDIGRLVARLRSNGFNVSNPTAGSRQRPDGTVLKWQAAGVEDSTLTVAPFFIEWAAGAPHPSTSSPAGCHLSDLHLVEPRAERLSQLLSLLEFRAAVEAGPPHMSFSLVCARGVVSFGQ